ncbi:vWA domain-containing protein [Trueperella pyogenes]|uniref:vWA domain-containing protein n=1 Tax=Trueperella pyogenes TaxID=1661 RepID=UPI003132B8F1
MSAQYLIGPIPLAAIGVVGLAFIGLGLRADRAQRMGWLRRLGMLAMVVAMGLAPGVVVGTKTVTSNLAVVFVVDATGSMAAEDQGAGRRLDGVKADATAILNALPGAHFAVVEYSSNASQQLPLTTDKQAVRTWFAAYDREITEHSSGSSVNRPVTEVESVLKGIRDAGELEPVVILMTDGESTDAAASRRSEEPDFTSWRELVDGGLVLGYGTQSGGKMIRRDIGGDTGDYILAPNGQTAISHANPAALQQIADQIGVPYLHRSGDVARAELTSALTELAATASEDARTPMLTVVIWPFAAVFTVLMAWEIYTLVPRLRNACALAARPKAGKADARAGTRGADRPGVQAGG